MTDDTRDPIADWNAQFAPAPAGTVETPRAEVERLGTVEHFADADGVFVPPVAAAEAASVEAEPAEAPADDAPKGKGKKGDAETAA